VYALIPDHQITRRKKLNHVLDDHGDLLFSSADLVSCLQFLIDAGQLRFNVQTAEQHVVYVQIWTDDAHENPSNTRCPDDPI